MRYRNTIKLFIILGLASFACGMAYGLFTNSPKDKDVGLLERHVERLEAGQTVEGIVHKYYDRDKSGRTWQEYKYHNIEVLNGSLFKNRVPQVGDVVLVEVRK